jgi:toxin-antitoxin system PIN domain toxin
MKLLDLNILIYAVNRDSPSHEAARTWLERTLGEDDAVGIPWIVILGFLRITTSPRALRSPLSADQALAVVDGWLAQPQVAAIGPGESHWEHLRKLLAAAGTAGNLTTDAHIAALALECEAELCSTDADFGRFDRVRRVNPLTA